MYVQQNKKNSNFYRVFHVPTTNWKHWGIDFCPKQIYHGITKLNYKVLFNINQYFFLQIFRKFNMSTFAKEGWLNFPQCHLPITTICCPCLPHTNIKQWKNYLDIFEDILPTNILIWLNKDIWPEILRYGSKYQYK